jgi:hypothetical protein
MDSGSMFQKSTDSPGALVATVCPSGLKVKKNERGGALKSGETQRSLG